MDRPEVALKFKAKYPTVDSHWGDVNKFVAYIHYLESKNEELEKALDDYCNHPVSEAETLAEEVERISQELSQASIG